MLELTTNRKNKINLGDYPYKEDIENRILLSDFTNQDIEVSKEILYSPLRFSFKKFCRSQGWDEAQTSLVLQKISNGGLLQIQGDIITVDKEKRKYFEFQLSRFDEDFLPNMEFLQGMLKQVPIQVLPSWYSIPRTSNNIFESIIEKYLLTPQIYQRHLTDLSFSDSVIHSIVQDVFTSPSLRVSSSDLIAKYNLKREHFEEIMLQLEFNFVCFVTYTREDEHWHEWVAPLQEWREHLDFIRKTEAPAVSNSIDRYRANDFGFVEDVGTLLQLIKKKPLSLESWNSADSLPQSLVNRLAGNLSLSMNTEDEKIFAEKYLQQLLEKSLLLKLVHIDNGRLCCLDAAYDWINLNLENRALFLYRHPLNRLLNKTLSPSISSERNLRESEKSIKRVLHGEWVRFDDFITGAIVAFNDDSVVTLKKTGKHWKYALPQYTDEEKMLIKAAIFEFLFECGMVATGKSNGQDCFAVTPFGQFFFAE